MSWSLDSRQDHVTSSDVIDDTAAFASHAEALALDGRTVELLECCQLAAVLHPHPEQAATALFFVAVAGTLNGADGSDRIARARLVDDPMDQTLCPCSFG